MSLVDPDPDQDLTDEELVRYSRQIVLREVGGAGQLRLRSARVAVVGAGGLGSPALLYLAAAGVGHLTVVDGDAVSLDNLHRQILFDTDAIGRPKAAEAADRLCLLNPAITVRPVVARLDEANAAALLGGHHVVVEASDNLATKFLVNDVCVRLGIAAVIGAVLRFEGQVVTVPPGAACYRCFFREEPVGPARTCRDEGVLGPAAGIVGSLQAVEALRLLVGLGGGQSGRLIEVDALRPRVREIAFPADPGCTACAAKPEAVVAPA
ncbi:MAG TPA: HesA/MoeB/ThiF family protein [Candidatus Dormibacteraeota bacterium]|nr:HesA/MoeB/ThiF family protein [Candidatus Dormibacteraeota bacterium]